MEQLMKHTALPEIVFPTFYECHARDNVARYAIGFFLGISSYDYSTLGAVTISLCLLLEWWKNRKHKR